MPGSTDTGRDCTVRLSAVGRPPVRDESAPIRAISVLFETVIDEWRRRWYGPESGPAHEAVVSAGEVTRGAAAAQMVPRRRLAHTTLDASAETDASGGPTTAGG